MERKGTITYEINEEEYKKITNAINDLDFYFKEDLYREDAESGLSSLKEIFETE